MAIFCCCSQLRTKKRTPQPTLQNDNLIGLPTRPPPAKLPPSDPNPAPLSPQSTVDRSSLTNPLLGAAADSSIQLGELVVEDSDDDHGDDGMTHDSKNRSTSTLQAVKAAIRRHLSQDSLTRQSETEEQIARRAEVKRLMRQRIQEELRSETDEVLSGSSTPPRLGTGSIHLPAHGPRDTIEFTVDDTKKEKEATEYEPPCLTDSTQHDPHRRLSRLSKKHSTRSLKAQIRPASLQSHSKQRHTEVHSLSGTLNHLRRRSSVPEIPSSPLLEPVHVPSFCDASSLASWRLSLSADKLAELFAPDKGLSPYRPIASSSDICSAADTKDWESVKHTRSKSSPLVVRDLEATSRAHSRQASFHSDYRTQIPVSQSLLRGESPIGLWLQTQSQNFRLSTASQSAHDAEDESTGRPSSGFTVIQRPGDVTGENHGADVAQTMKAQDGLGYHEKPERSSTMIKRKRSLPGRYSRSLSLHSENKENIKDLADISQDELSAFELDSPLSVTLATPAVVSGNPVTLPSSPANVATVPSVKEKRWIGFDVLRLSYFQCNQSPSRNHTGTRVAQNPCSTYDSNGPTPNGATPDSQRTNVDAGSDTSSFLCREVELATVEERFRDSHLRKGPLTPVESKFREVFYDGTDAASKRSLLGRLHLTVPSQGTAVGLGKYDGTGPEPTGSSSSPINRPDSQSHGESDPLSHGHLKVPTVDHASIKHKSQNLSTQYSERGGRSTRGFSSSKDGDETAEMWKRALRGESVARSPRSSTSAHKSDSNSVRGGPRYSGRVSKSTKATDHSHRSGADSDDHSPTCNEALPQDEDEKVWQSLVRSNTVLEEWARQLEGQEREAKVNTQEIHSTSRAISKSSLTPPASWARYPSHNREERNAAAGPGDRVKPKDFAVKEVTAGGKVSWITDKDEADVLDRKSMIRSFSGRFSQPFKSRWSRLLPSGTGTPSRDKSMLGKRRSSLQTSGDLEYPELELLPTAGGYKELRALEREIIEMKRRVGPDKRASSDGMTTRPSLTDRMDDVAQHDGVFESSSNTNSCGGSVITRRSTSPTCRRLSTPVYEMKRRDAAPANRLTDSSGQRFATPFSHISQSPCESSRAVLFANGNQTSTIPPSPISSRTSVSVVRRSSMTEPNGHITLTVSVSRCKSWGGRGTTKRESAVLLTTPISP